MKSAIIATVAALDFICTPTFMVDGLPVYDCHKPTTICIVEILEESGTVSTHEMICTRQATGWHPNPNPEGVINITPRQ